MKRIKYFVILLIMFLANITLVFAKDDVINKIDINITLDNSGNAHVEEIWDVKANMGTEFYKGMYNLGNMKVTNFKVYENNTLFTYVDKWNIDASLDEKKNKNGINYTSKGIELCFGKGSMGRHVFKLTYDISNFVFKTNDSLVIYYQIINMNMTPPPKNFSLVLTGPNAFDKDIDACNYSKERLSLISNNFKIFNTANLNIKTCLENENVTKVDGILFDLGVSSVELDEASRGFSYIKDAKLDMRMDQKSDFSAYDVVNNYDEKELADIIYRYGEEKFSRRIAANIVKSREKKPIETTFELVDIIKASMPQRAMRDSHPARKTFQAIRIEVNAELDVLKSTLEDAFEILAPGGRIAVITFHSLEDRIVKEQFSKWCQGCTCPKEFPVCVCGNKPKGKSFKSISPSKEELDENPRARSSRLRIFEKF